MVVGDHEARTNGGSQFAIICLAVSPWYLQVEAAIALHNANRKAMEVFFAHRPIADGSRGALRGTLIVSTAAARNVVSTVGGEAPVTTSESVRVARCARRLKASCTGSGEA